METIYLAGGCFWGVQQYFRVMKGVEATEVGMSNAKDPDNNPKIGEGAETVKITFDPKVITALTLIERMFEVIEPFSINKQGEDVGVKYRTGIYSEDPKHLEVATNYINSRSDGDRVKVEVLPLTNYRTSEDFHQDYLIVNPTGYCHINRTARDKYIDK